MGKPWNPGDVTGEGFPVVLESPSPAISNPCVGSCAPGDPARGGRFPEVPSIPATLFSWDSALPVLFGGFGGEFVGLFGVLFV